MFNHLNYSTGSDQIRYCRLSSECDLYQHCPLWHLLHMGLKPVSTKLVLCSVKQLYLTKYSQISIQYFYI